jgi:hypothetical protein
LTDTNALQGVYPAFMVVLLNKSVWSAPEDEIESLLDIARPVKISVISSSISKIDFAMSQTSTSSTQLTDHDVLPLNLRKTLTV